MPSLKLKPGNTVTWRSLDWKVFATDDETIELRPKRPEIAAIIGPIKFRREIPLPTSPTIKVESQDLVIPDSLEPKDWKPTQLRWKFLAEARFQSTEMMKLLWGTAVPIDRLNRQLLPTYHALKQKTPRILIADDVGLGKTTEAGLLISELLARTLAERVLVIAPAHLAFRKWERELNRRFGLCFSRVDSSCLTNIHESKLLTSDENPFQHVDRLILSLDYAKEPHICRKLEEAGWDLVVFDECHRIAKRGETERGSALRYRLASRLSVKTKGLVLISGTPHDGDDSSFESLIELLSRKSDALPQPPQPILIRRLRKEIDASESLLSPEPEFATFEPTKGWIGVAELLSTFLQAIKEKEIVGSDLFQVTAFKRFLSSPQALRKTLGFTQMAEDTESGGDGNDDNSDEIARSRLVAEDAREHERLSATLTDLDRATSDLSNEDPKRSWLTSFISKLPKDDRLIIFTEFADTAEALHQFLDGQAQARKAFLVTGSDQRSITKTLDSFGKKKGAILVTTDTLSEGIDLQEHCHRLLHYDLPFRPYRLEQRNGRIDRMGQKHRPIITMLVPNEKKLADARGQLIVLKALSVARLYEHLARQKKQLGSIVPVLESIKSLQGKSEKRLFLNIENAASEVEQYSPSEEDNTPVVGNVTIGKHTYLRDRTPSTQHLNWSGQSDLGLSPNLISKLSPLYEFLSVFFQEGTGLPVSIDSGVVSGELMSQILLPIYPALDQKTIEKMKEWVVLPLKDFVNEPNGECLTWGHSLWTEFSSALSYKFTEPTNVALSPLKGPAPVLLSLWKCSSGTVIRGAKKKNRDWEILGEEEARTLLGEELALVGSESRNVVQPKKQFEEEILNAFSVIQRHVLAQNASSEFIGLVYRPNVEN